MIRYAIILCVLLSLAGSTLHASRKGTPVNGKFPGVAYITAFMEEGSGVLIGPKTVLTVYHFLEEIPVGGIFVHFQLAPERWSKTYTVKSMMVLSKKDRRKELVLLNLREKPPVKPYAIYSGTFTRGMSMTGIGFGNTENEDDDNMVCRSAKMKLKRVVSMEDATTAIPAGKDLPHMLEFLPGSSGQISCHGDSGGPVFVRRSDGSHAVAGVMSHIVSKITNTRLHDWCKNAELARAIPAKDYLWWIAKNKQN